jgi:outer membrane lipoprotein-sorting protein
MKITRFMMPVTAAFLLCMAASAQDNELHWTIDSAIKQLDRQASDFDSALAEVTATWSDNADTRNRVASGRLYMNKKGVFRIDTATNRIRVDDDYVNYYSASQARVDEYRLSQHPERIEPYIAIGFSDTGSDLNKDYLVTYIGEKSTTDRRLLGLELTPKNEKTRGVISKIDLWVDQASWMPAQQVIVQAAGGATLTLDYSGMARNLALNSDLFSDNWPKGTQKVKN